MEPQELAAALVAADPSAPGREQFVGYGVMGLTFGSGHVLGLRHWDRSSVGPAYTSVWHRGPEGGWSFWSTAPAEVSCTRDTGELAEDVRVTAIDVSWPTPRRLVVDVADPSLRWEVDLRPTPVTRLLTAVARRLPPSLASRRPLLRVLGPAAGRLLGTGPLALVGTMPNRQSFRLVPAGVWSVAGSRAVLGGHDLGAPAPLPEQATIGDFRIPQRGLLAVGAVDFDPLDPARHSTTVRRSAPS